MWLMALSVIEADSCDAFSVKTVLPEVAANYVGVIGPCPLDENGDGQMFDYDVMGWLETEAGVYEFIKFGYYDAVEDDFVWYEDYLTLLREKIRK